MDTSEPYMLLSGYRSPETNAMLRRRSRGVAKNSLHMKGQAADLRLTSRSVNQMARAAKNEIHFGRFLPIAELVAKVDAVDRDTLIRCARSWFDPDRLVHAAHRPASRH